MSLRIGSICSGYEGIGRAVHDVLGGDLAWVADNDPGAAAILAHRFPGVPNLGDITTVDWSQVEPVDIFCAGTPCQDISAAGKRAGMRRGTRSGLWLEAVHAIRALRPGLVVFENVRGLLTARGDDPTPEHLAAEAAAHATQQLLDWLDNEHNWAIKRGDIRRVRQCAARTVRVMGLRKRAVARCQWHEQRLVRAIGTVLGSLADLGYDARWLLVSAADAGAPHRRERVFLVAWPAADPASADERWRRTAGSAEPGTQPGESRRPLAEPDDRGLHSAADADDDPARTRREPGDARGGRSEPSQRRWPTPADAKRGGRRPEPWQQRRLRPAQYKPGDHGDAADTESERGQRHHGAVAGDPAGNEGDGSGTGHRRAPADSEHDGCAPGAVGASTREATPERKSEWLPADADGQSPRGRDVPWGVYELAIRRWEHVTGRPAPRPTEPGRTGERLSPRFVEWLMGLPEGWVTDVPGLTRNAQLKALGNGVVPQQCALALRILLADFLAADPPAEVQAS